MKINRPLTILRNVACCSDLLNLGSKQPWRIIICSLSAEGWIPLQACFSGVIAGWSGCKSNLYNEFNSFHAWLIPSKLFAIIGRYLPAWIQFYSSTGMSISFDLSVIGKANEIVAAEALGLDSNAYTHEQFFRRTILWTLETLWPPLSNVHRPVDIWKREYKPASLKTLMTDDRCSKGLTGRFLKCEMLWWKCCMDE